VNGISAAMAFGRWCSAGEQITARYQDWHSRHLPTHGVKICGGVSLEFSFIAASLSSSLNSSWIAHAVEDE
jgi:hypothetical protein